MPSPPQVLFVLKRGFWRSKEVSLETYTNEFKVPNQDLPKVLIRFNQSLKIYLAIYEQINTPTVFKQIKFPASDDFAVQIKIKARSHGSYKVSLIPEAANQLTDDEQTIIYYSFYHQYVKSVRATVQDFESHLRKTNGNISNIEPKELAKFLQTVNDIQTIPTLVEDPYDAFRGTLDKDKLCGDFKHFAARIDNVAKELDELKSVGRQNRVDKLTKKFIVMLPLLLVALGVFRYFSLHPNRFSNIFEDSIVPTSLSENDFWIRLQFPLGLPMLITLSMSSWWLLCFLGKLHAPTIPTIPIQKQRKANLLFACYLALIFFMIAFPTLYPITILTDEQFEQIVTGAWLIIGLFGLYLFISYYREHFRYRTATFFIQQTPPSGNSLLDRWLMRPLLTLIRWKTVALVIIICVFVFNYQAYLDTFAKLGDDSDDLTQLTFRITISLYLVIGTLLIAAIIKISRPFWKPIIDSLKAINRDYEKQYIEGLKKLLESVQSAVSTNIVDICRNGLQSYLGNTKGFHLLLVSEPDTNLYKHIRFPSTNDTVASVDLLHQCKLKRSHFLTIMKMNKEKCEYGLLCTDPGSHKFELNIYKYSFGKKEVPESGSHGSAFTAHTATATPIPPTAVSKTRSKDFVVKTNNTPSLVCLGHLYWLSPTNDENHLFLYKFIKGANNNEEVWEVDCYDHRGNYINETAVKAINQEIEYIQLAFDDIKSKNIQIQIYYIEDKINLLVFGWGKDATGTTTVHTHLLEFDIIVDTKIKTSSISFEATKNSFSFEDIKPTYELDRVVPILKVDRTATNLFFYNYDSKSSKVEIDGYKLERRPGSPPTNTPMNPTNLDKNLKKSFKKLIEAREEKWEIYNIIHNSKGDIFLVRQNGPDKQDVEVVKL